MTADWDARFLALAAVVATWSKDPSTRVGCVLVAPNRTVVGLGYNGFPRGVRDDDERLAHRPTKYLMTVHAEANAVLNATASTRLATAYVTAPPCGTCAGLLIQAGVRRVVCGPAIAGLRDRFAESFAAADAMFAEAGVVVSRAD